MIDISKKYLHKKEDDNPNLGNFVNWFIKQQGIKKITVARELNVSPNTVNRYFKQPSIQFNILWRLSRIINYNMIMDLGQRLKIPFETDVEKELKVQLAEKEELIKKMEIQLEVFREMRNK